MITRRQLLQATSTAWFADQALPDELPIEGRIVGASHRVGHLLRGAVGGRAASHEEADVLVVGSGVSGASAAWRLADAGVEVLMLELEPFAGGTSTWGDDGVVPHPWGAHYLPVPERGARSTRRLLEQLGVIQGWDAASRPLFDASMLCHAPEERLYYQGKWVAGLIPHAALAKRELAQVVRFRERMAEFRNALGADGREAFAIVAAESSRDPKYLALDRISMGQWLAEAGFDASFLRWYAEYGCLDDFGGNLDDTSAWAGIHYYAARKLETEQTDGSRYLVWPEGNGWLVRRMLATLLGERRHGALVVSVEPAKRGVEVSYLDVATHALHRVTARAAIVAAPAFVTLRLLQRTLSEASAQALPVRAASPWVVANLHLRRVADPNRTWDNVIYDSPGLGYVDASHQRTALEERGVFTYFRAYGDRDVAATRTRLLHQSWATLSSEILADLSRAHPEMIEQVERCDVMIWGHAMPRPRPGFLGSSPFEAPVELAERIAWAHVDQTGFALFEEANAHGVRAAEAIGPRIGVDLGSTWT